MPIFNLLLFIITLLAGSVPLWFKGLNDRSMNLLLAFSGSFLLSITFLHLLHETFEELHATAGLYLLIGFFLQLIIQKVVHLLLQFFLLFLNGLTHLLLFALLHLLLKTFLDVLELLL